MAVQATQASSAICDWAAESTARHYPKELHISGGCNLHQWCIVSILFHVYLFPIPMLASDELDTQINTQSISRGFHPFPQIMSYVEVFSCL
ncbi:hypothetical protein DM860_009455 [Cuscuta australis]|uniref:Uncharacterized protein n=1 Tax=Cuscuta australis TaxID=267555 RepID=A0A328DN16_9ASTE|nr:hypothetical protein DM860_009455 [Cuscuta australis]